MKTVKLSPLFKAINEAVAKAATVHESLQVVAMQALIADRDLVTQSESNAMPNCSHMLRALLSKPSLSRHAAKYQEWLRAFNPLRINAKADGGAIVVGAKNDEKGIDCKDSGQWYVEKAEGVGFWLYKADKVQSDKSMTDLVKAYYRGAAKLYAAGTLTAAGLEPVTIHVAVMGLSQEQITAIIDGAIKECATIDGNTTLPANCPVVATALAA